MMQTSDDVAFTVSIPPLPTMQLSWPNSVMLSMPALPRMRVCETLFKRNPDPLRSAVRPSELQPAGVSWENCRAFNDLPTWLTGTLVLAVKLVTSVAATIRVRSPAPARAAVARLDRRRQEVPLDLRLEGSLASPDTAAGDGAASTFREGR